MDYVHTNTSQFFIFSLDSSFFISLFGFTYTVSLFGVFQHPAILYCDATLRGTKIH